MNKGKDVIVGIGEILWDIFPDKTIMGGAPANFAYHISQLGFESYAVSAVGDDLNGNLVLENLNSKNLKHLIEKVDFPTGTVTVELDEAGIPQYVITEDVAWDNIPFTHTLSELASRTTTVCFGSLAQRSPVSRDSIRKFISQMPPGSIKIFDINLRQNFYSMEILEDSLYLSNILKINDDEILILADLYGLSGTEENICCELKAANDLDVLILTKGTKGSYVYAGQDVSFQPTPLVKVADTVGAGDSFTAAFTAAHLKGLSVEESHKFAVEVSAYVCTQNGAMPILDPKYLNLINSKS